jgi:uncharacterized protein (TIGR01777 family)
MNLESKAFLVTGGTGFIGHALCTRLREAGFHVYVLTRRKELSLSNHDDGNIYITTLNTLNNIEIYGIINFAGEPISQRWTKKVKKKIYDSRIVTTRQIVAYIASLKKKPTLLISSSAVGYYGTDAQKIFDEETDIPAKEGGFAQPLCKYWEEEARKAEALGVRVVLLRIGPVLEKDGGILSKLLPSFYLGLGSTIGNGEQWLSWIDRDDLIALIFFIIAHSKICGPINATAPHPVTHKHFASTLAKTLGRLCLLRIPSFVLQFIFGQMADEIMLAGQNVQPQKALLDGFEFRYPTIEKSLQKIFR